MNLNPRIKTSFLWFVVTFAACVCFAAAVYIQAGVLYIVALPVLLLVPYLSGMAAIHELSPESRALPVVRMLSAIPHKFLGVAIVAIIILSPGLGSYNPLVRQAAVCVLFVAEVSQFIITLRLLRRAKERCVVLALLTQILAGIPFLCFFATVILEGRF